MRKFTATANDEGMRIDRFVIKVCKKMPHSMLHKAFRNKRIKLNGKRALPETKIYENDLIELYINDEYFENIPRPNFFEANISNLELKIIYEDINIAILHKPAGILSHSGENGGDNLLSAFIEYLKEKDEFKPEQENTFKPALCNRLDRGTEGLLIAAKNHAALAEINNLLKHGFISKKYLTVACGKITNGVYSAYLKRDKNSKMVSVSANEIDGAKKIITGVKTIETYDNLSLVEIDLMTGRTHQIRAHLAFLGCPVLGDNKYGNAVANKKYKLNSQLLCSSYLNFSLNVPADNMFAYLRDRAFSIEKQNNVASFWHSLPHYNK